LAVLIQIAQTAERRANLLYQFGTGSTIIGNDIMTTDVVAAKTFEEKMTDRIKEQIGDLIDHDALKRLVEQGIQKAFFEGT